MDDLDLDDLDYGLDDLNSSPSQLSKVQWSSTVEMVLENEKLGKTTGNPMIRSINGWVKC